MKKLFAFLLFALAFASCADNDATSTEREQPEAAVEVPRSVVLEPLKKLVLLQKENPSFLADNFSDFFPAGAMDTTAARRLEKERVMRYASYLIYNKDSSLALDTYSYSHFFLPGKGDQGLKSGSPDTELAVVNFKEDTRQRIAYFGPSYTLLDAGWKDNSTVLVAVGAITGENKIHPEVWELSLQQFSKKISAYPDTLLYQVQ